MAELEGTSNRQITNGYRLLVVVGALALSGVGACGDAGSGAESTTTESSVPPEVTPPTLGISDSTTIPPATTIPVATTVAGGAVGGAGGTFPGATIPRPTIPIPVATTIPVPVTAPAPSPSATITLDQNSMYDGTLTCPNQTVDFTVTVSNLPPGATSSVWYQTNYGYYGAAVLGGDRYRIPRQNTSPQAQGPTITVWVYSSVDLNPASVLRSAGIAYIDGAFPPCTPG
jgi:hypothetical protein